jgi:hypothetical protein
MRKIAEELKPIYEQLKNEGFEVYSYTCESNKDNEITSFYWYENGRVLNIQPSTWYNSRYNRDCFHISVSYIPSTQNGSGCGLSESNWGIMAEDLLNHRNIPTWVNRIENYKSMDDFLKRETILKFHKVEE